MPEYQVNLPPKGIDRLLDAEAVLGRRLPINQRLIEELLKQVQASTGLLRGVDRLSIFRPPSQSFQSAMMQQLQDYVKPAVVGTPAVSNVFGLGPLGMLAALLSLGGSSDPNVLRMRGLLPREDIRSSEQPVQPITRIYPDLEELYAQPMLNRIPKMKRLIPLPPLEDLRPPSMGQR